jgi:anaphase-promoting complex subunit 10
VPQLRSPEIDQFWQSDGPQPHLLNIHFFKQVSIVAMRLYLDFEADESYTPTRIQFLAGTGYNDLQEWAEMKLEQPKGWIDVDFADVGREEVLSESDNEVMKDQEGSEEDEDNDEEEEADEGDSSSSILSSDNDRSSKRRRRRGFKGRKKRRIPVLKAYLVQVKILENHQNGKDTHLRGVQIFARDRSRHGDNGMAARDVRRSPERDVGRKKPKKKNLLSFSDWMTIPELR